jgi:hypothetical protein
LTVEAAKARFRLIRAAAARLAARKYLEPTAAVSE